MPAASFVPGMTENGVFFISIRVDLLSRSDGFASIGDRFRMGAVMDALTIGSALTSLKTAADIAKTLIGLRDEEKIRDKVIELQSAILSAQSDALNAQAEQQQLSQKIASLDAEIVKLNAWETEKQRYRLREIHQNSFVYELKVEAANGEPIHRICPTCFERGNKTILQGENSDFLICPACKTRIRASGPYFAATQIATLSSDPFRG